MENNKFYKKKVIIFGAGYYGEKGISALEFLGAHILALVDNNRNLEGSKIKGIPIIHFYNFVNQSITYDYVLIGSIIYSEEIKKQLLNTGIQSNKILEYNKIREYIANIASKEIQLEEVDDKNTDVYDNRINILYDGQIFSDQKVGGISRYFYEVIKKISTRTDFITDFVAGYTVSELPLEDLSKNNKYIVRNCYGPFTEDRELRFLTNKKIIREYSDTHYEDIYHPCYFTDMGVRNYNKLIVTIYDMIHELFNIEDNTKINKKQMLNKADSIIAISESTKKDLIDIYSIDENRISVVYLANSLNYNVSEKRVINNSYILYVGNRSLYKQFDLLAKAFSESIYSKELLLVCFGGGELKKEEKENLDRLGIKERVQHVNGDDIVLSNLYKYAEIFVYPSAYEGFGLPILEAMHYGTPVLTANISSMPEVGGEAAEYFDSGSVESLKGSMDRLLSDTGKRKRLSELGLAREKTFSWDKCAKETADVYRKLLKR